jgi:formylmethanofuran dehydrogenase subunit E
MDEHHKVIGIVTVRDLLTVSTELNDLLEDLIVINREEIIEQGMCDRCSQMSDDLKRVDGVMVCPGCRDEDKIT